MTNEAIDYTAQIKDLQTKLQAPFTEINAKLELLKKTADRHPEAVRCDYS